MPIMRRNSYGHMKLVKNEGVAPEEVYFNASNREDPLQDVDATPNPHEYVTYPTPVAEKINEYFVLSDTTTRDALFLNEANGSRVLTNLTSKLYDHIVKKTTDIDYGDIPKTKGDITKLPAYADLKDVCSIVKGILTEFKEKSGPIDTINVAIANIEARKDLFERAYRADCELPVMIYENAVYDVIASVSYLIATSIEFIKAPKDETFQMQVDKVAYAKSRDHLCYQALDKFNKACENGDLNKACEHVISHRIRKFVGGAGIAATAIAVGVVVILGIIPLIRELIYCVYYMRVSLSDFLSLQADMLTMNAYNVEANSAIDPEKRKEIAHKQVTVADNFRKLSNIIQIDSKSVDVKASKELENSAKKYTVDGNYNIEDDDIQDDPVNGSSSLF